jgi:arylsulfatase A-like enzyme
MGDARPNVLVIMTDEERYPPPYETPAIAEFRRTHLPARERLRARSRELHRHYVGATACLPSRTTLFTGQYPSLHGVTDTDGLAKSATDPAMAWLDPDSVPTLGDWFRAAGYRTHYRGKWHISHADLVVPGTHRAVRASDEEGVPDPLVVEAYRRADRLDRFGFSGWIGREPHGPDKSNTGTVRDGVFAEQVVELFSDLAAARDEGPWLTVASFVNPHDIAFSGIGWEQILGYGPPPDTVPDIPEAPSQADSFAGRPSAQRAFFDVWPQLLYEQPRDAAYRRLYYHLHALVDAAIMRVLDALAASGCEDDTIVVFTSDHGDLLGAHGGLQQKWHNAFDECTRVPLLVSGPGIDASAPGVHVPTSHVDLVPTLLGLAGGDVEAAAAAVATHHVETQSLPGRDLSALLGGAVDEDAVDAPVYFMTEDQISRGGRTTNMFTGAPVEPVGEPCKVESVVVRCAVDSGAPVLWKLNHYYERLAAWEDAHGVAGPFAAEPVDDQWELHDLTHDPEERTNLVATRPEVVAELRGVLEKVRDDVRRVPTLASRSS